MVVMDQILIMNGLKLLKKIMITFINFNITILNNVVVDFYKSRGTDFTKRSKTLQCVIWSLSVQHGTSGAVYIINKQNLGFSNDLKDDANFIRGIYAERRKVDIYFSSSTQSIKNAVFNRFINEERDALVMLKKELK